MQEAEGMIEIEAYRPPEEGRLLGRFVKWGLIITSAAIVIATVQLVEHRELVRESQISELRAWVKGSSDRSRQVSQFMSRCTFQYTDGKGQLVTSKIDKACAARLGSPELIEVLGKAEKKVAILPPAQWIAIALQK